MGIKMKLTDIFWKKDEIDLQEVKISYLNWAITHARESVSECLRSFGSRRGKGGSGRCLNRRRKSCTKSCTKNAYFCILKKKGFSKQLKPFKIMYFWCRRPDLNRHGCNPLPPQDSVSTKFHHFGII